MTILWEEKLSYMPTTTTYVKIISDGEKTDTIQWKTVQLLQKNKTGWLSWSSM